MTKGKLISIFMVFILLFGLSTWGLVTHYETKLKNQEIAHRNVLDKQREVAEKRFNDRVKLAEKTEDDYKAKISGLESKVRDLDSVNSDLDSTLDRMRKSERELRSRLDKLSSEAKREYAIAATEAFGRVSEALQGEQLACQDLARKAEQYWLGWEALDKAWNLPATKKESE